MVLHSCFEKLTLYPHNSTVSLTHLSQLDPLQDGNVPFHWACSTFMREGILYLSRLSGVDVNVANAKGVSPLMCLLKSHHLPQDTQEIVSLLEAVDFNFTHKDNEGRNMFCYAAMSQVGTWVDIHFSKSCFISV